MDVEGASQSHHKGRPANYHFANTGKDRGMSKSKQAISFFSFQNQQESHSCDNGITARSNEFSCAFGYLPEWFRLDTGHHFSV